MGKPTVRTIGRKPFKACLVDREQLRRKAPSRTFGVHKHLKGVTVKTPTPPSSFSWSQNGKLTYPVLGNDQYGDCYYAAVCHGSQTFSGNAAGEDTFDAQAVIDRYLAIAGGDNGLDDGTIMPEWKTGIVGPNGPAKILDEMTVDPSDDAATALAMWAFGGLIFTCSLLDTWLNTAGPGDTWDAGGRPDPNAGHAIYLTGKQTNGNYELQTWGFSPCVNLTPAGLKAADPELIVAFSLDQFKADGTCAFTGMSYADKAALWKACGGADLPPSPFNPPTPPTPPAPPTPPGSTNVLVITQDLPAGNYPIGQPLAFDAGKLLCLVNDMLIATGSQPVTLPAATVAALQTAGPVPWGKLLQIVFLVLAAVQTPGGLTPAAVQALIAQILAILTGK